MTKTSSISIVVGIIAIFLLGLLMFLGNQNKDVMYPNGLNVTTLENGSGDPIQNGQTAVVRYTGMFDDGTVFDSSYSRGETSTFDFTLGAGSVIKGWDLGVVGMKVGEKRKLIIAPELAYGSRAIGPIPPNSRLTFEVELVQIR